MLGCGGRLPLRVYVEQVHEEIIGQNIWPLSEDAEFGLPDVGVQDTHTADEHLTLYLILDEAHRGMKPSSKGDRAEKATIVQRLVNGANGVPPVPIVWGISATVERFNNAMAKAENRTSYPPVVVDPARVQESGLLKDDIRLDFPAETGQFDTVLLARATRKVKRATELWRTYVQQEGPAAEAVVPLLVVQVPNKPSDELLLSVITTIRET